MHVTCTSRAALKEVDTSKARERVFAMLLTREDWTRQELADALGWAINRVTPRVLELIDPDYGLEVVEQVGYCRKNVSGRSANVIRVKQEDSVPPAGGEGIDRPGDFMGDEIKRYADKVMAGDSKEARRTILNSDAVPFHLREKVKLHVIMEFAKRKRGAK